MSAKYFTYLIWRRQHGESHWTKTSHSVIARTDKEAEAKVRRRFAEAGFTTMSLLAVLNGKNPNKFL